MKRILIFLSLLFFAMQCEAQTIEIIKLAIEKAIRTVDLEVQRLQNETLWLQNAAKLEENAMNATRLNEITNLAQKQKDLYADYFKELRQVKSVITNSSDVSTIIDLQSKLMNEVRQYKNSLQADEHFSSEERDYMYKVYDGIANESKTNLQQIYAVTGSSNTSMSDAERIKIIKKYSVRIEENYADLHQFSNQNIKIRLQRSKDENDIKTIKKIYGLP